MSNIKFPTVNRAGEILFGWSSKRIFKQDGESVVWGKKLTDISEEGWSIISNSVSLPSNMTDTVFWPNSSSETWKKIFVFYFWNSKARENSAKSINEVIDHIKRFGKMFSNDYTSCMNYAQQFNDWHNPKVRVFSNLDVDWLWFR